MILRKRITIFIFILAISQICSLTCYAQEQEDEISDYSQLNDKDIQNIKLPPLSLLFENVKKSPTYQFSENAVAIQKKLLAKQKKDFLSFFSIRGSYQYGKVANDAYYSDVYTPATTNFSSSTQNLYSVGAGLNLPLDKIFDIGPSIKRQKLAVRSAEIEREMKLEELKKQIIELYSSITLNVSVLKLYNEALVQSNVLYDIMERNFANAKAKPEELVNAKAAQSQSKQIYEKCKFEILRDMMSLELISHTSFFKNNK